MAAVANNNRDNGIGGSGGRGRCAWWQLSPEIILVGGRSAVVGLVWPSPFEMAGDRQGMDRLPDRPKTVQIGRTWKKSTALHYFVGKLHFGLQWPKSRSA